jgi:hypothetical protein
VCSNGCGATSCNVPRRCESVWESAARGHEVFRVAAKPARSRSALLVRAD